jgi:hypothetical protein
MFALLNRCYRLAGQSRLVSFGSKS